MLKLCVVPFPAGAYKTLILFLVDVKRCCCLCWGVAKSSFWLRFDYVRCFPVPVGDRQESEKAHFNPTGLVRSLRDWEGQPLDVMVQQDASEFLTQFFQQVRWFFADGGSRDGVKLRFRTALTFLESMYLELVWHAFFRSFKRLAPLRLQREKNVGKR